MLTVWLSSKVYVLNLVLKDSSIMMDSVTTVILNVKLVLLLLMFVILVKMDT